MSGEPEPYQGFDDVVSVWMALITEGERLQKIVETHVVDGKRLDENQVLEVQKQRERVDKLASFTLGNKDLAAVFSKLSE